MVINMLTGTQAGLTARRPEFFAMMMGLRFAFEENKNCVILETDNWPAYEAISWKFSEGDKYEPQKLNN